MTTRHLTLADCLVPRWQAPPRVRALITTREGGVSAPPFGCFRDGVALPGGLNLGLHTGDDPTAVEANRMRLMALAGVNAVWLDQVHSDTLVQLEANMLHEGLTPMKADASVTTVRALACVVMMADCLPVLFADQAGRAVGAAHAGWRGLAAGIVEKTAARVAELAGVKGDALHAYLGPALGSQAFEVGEDVRDAFLQAADVSERVITSAAFVPVTGAPGKFFANLYALARVRIARCGAVRVSGGDRCTLNEAERFYSYRRDRITGRMAAMIWLAD